MIFLTPKPLDADGFALFGTLVDTASRPGIVVNEGRGRRLDAAAMLQHGAEAKTPALALYRMQASPWPVTVRLMERHRHSAQMFLSLSGGQFLVVAAQAGHDGWPDPGTAAAFVGAPGQGIAYAPGIWHLPMVSLLEAGTFAMMMWETGGPGDCDVCPIDPPLQVQLQATKPETMP